MFGHIQKVHVMVRRMPFFYEIRPVVLEISGGGAESAPPPQVNVILAARKE